MCRKLICVVTLVVVLNLVIARPINAVTAVGAWLFDEGSGTVIDDASGFGGTGTLVGDAEWIVGAGAVFGSALKFESGEYVDVGPPTPDALLIQQDVTIMSWVKPHEVLNNWQVILSMQRGSSGGEAYALTYGRNNDHLLALFNTQGGNGRVEDPDPITMDEWVHVASTYDGTKAVLFRNGEPVAEISTDIGGVLSHEDRQGRFAINANYNALNGDVKEHCSATLDEVLVFNEVLTQEDIQNFMEFGYESAGEPRVTSYRPDPADGAMLKVTWVQLSWKPGTTAVSHNVYISDNFEDVNTGADSAFQGNQTGDFQIVGFFGFPIPDGLVPGTTYYWRIDDVEADGTVNTGEVWSFWLPSLKGYDANPADGAQYVGIEPTLSWTGGLNSIAHYVYFGTDADQVAAATGATPQTATTFAPDTLEEGTTYYWRIDEFDGINTHTGNVWSFSTVPILPVVDQSLLGWWKLDEGNGMTAVDWSGHGNHGTLTGDPQWVDGYDGGALDLEFSNTNDGVAVKAFDIATGGITISAWVRPESFAQDDGRIITKATGTGGNDHLWMLSTIAGEGDYVLRFRLKTDDGQDTTTLIAAGGALAVNEWTYAAAIWDGSSMVIYKDGVEVGREVKGGTAVATNPDLAIAIGNHLTGTTGNRAWDGMIDDVRVYNKALTAAELELVMRGDTARAWGPGPSQGSTPDIMSALPLSWSAGDNATQHDVYFGVDRDAVANADATDTTGVYRGRQAAVSFSPDEVEMGGGPYYWRIDEVAADGAITTGSVWRFTVADYIIVDDFESYNDIPAGEPGSTLVYATWIDGYDNPNANGSTIGYVTGASMESEETHGGRLSAPMGYNNTTAGLSEVTRTFTPSQDWKSHDVTVLSLWFFGYSTNTTGQLYVKINGVQVNYDGAATDLSVSQWHRWDIDLATVGTNLQSVTSLAVGVQGSGAIGTLLLDDIALYR